MIYDNIFFSTGCHNRVKHPPLDIIWPPTGQMDRNKVSLAFRLLSMADCLLSFEIDSIFVSRTVSVDSCLITYRWFWWMGAEWIIKSDLPVYSTFVI